MTKSEKIKKWNCETCESFINTPPQYHLCGKSPLPGYCGSSRNIERFLRDETFNVPFHYISRMKECPDKRFKSKGIITLCGSSRFSTTTQIVLNYKVAELEVNSSSFRHIFQETNIELTAQGYIVLSISVVIDKNKQDDETLRLKNTLAKLHEEKIAMSDAIFVIDVDGYIGESTKSEIEFAERHNKQIRYYSKEII